MIDNTYVIPESIVKMYSEGDCGIFALEMFRQTGFPIVTIEVEGTNGKQWFHAANMLPDGRIIDVMGIHSPIDFLTQWYARTPAVRPLNIGTWEPWSFVYELNGPTVRRFFADSEWLAPYWVDHILRTW